MSDISLTERFDAYIKFTNVTGECTDKGHEGWIAVPVLSLNIINKSRNTPQAGGWGTAVAQVGDLYIGLLFDKASLTLTRYLITGTHIAEVDIDVRRQGGKQVDWYKLVLKDAMITARELTFGCAEFAFNLYITAKTMKESYFPQAFDSGDQGAEVTYEWDVTTNEIK
ncbi:MAG: type VI secretion system tube protein Hcp [Enterobacteriaceae bacterium]|jgi:type VI secretion system secreted protein Hcp|nr:type VI secretion system tube protein Hcp [Enterobacteriaceae bacterium]